MNALLEKLIGTRAGQAAVDRIVAESAAEIEKENEQQRIEHIRAVNTLRAELEKAVQPFFARREKAESDLRKAQGAARAASEKLKTVLNEQRGIEFRFTREIDSHKRTMLELRLPDIDTSLEIIERELYRLRIGQNPSSAETQERTVDLQNCAREVRTLAEELPADALERAKEIRQGLESEVAV